MPEGPLGFQRLTNIGPFVTEEVDTNYRLIRGNSIEVLKEINNNKEDNYVDAIITDPPYGIDVDSFDQVEGDIAGDKNVDQALGIFESTIDEAEHGLVDGGPVLSFAGDQTLCDFMTRYVNEKFQVKQILIWDKINSGPPFQSPWWRYSYEMIIHASNGDPTYVNTNARDRDVLRFNSISTNQHFSKNHPAEKPVELVEYLIKSVTDKGDVVIDPFMGSGTTGVAAKNTERNFVGIELDKQFYNTAVRRMQ